MVRRHSPISRILLSSFSWMSLTAQELGIADNQPGLQSKKKGLSIEEKKGKVLEIFHESKDVYVLKVSVYR